ncbi:MAG: leucine-rich repeat domain-containing protein [Candidatus Babeliaceae bacterium]
MVQKINSRNHIIENIIMLKKYFIILFYCASIHSMRNGNQIMAIIETSDKACVTIPAAYISKLTFHQKILHAIENSIGIFMHHAQPSSILAFLGICIKYHDIDAANPFIPEYKKTSQLARYLYQETKISKHTLKDLVELARYHKAPNSIKNALYCLCAHTLTPEEIEKFDTPIYNNIARYYYLLTHEKLNNFPKNITIDVNEYMTYNAPLLVDKNKTLNLEEYTISDLSGIENIHDIRTTQSLFVAHNTLRTLPVQFSATLNNMQKLDLSHNELAASCLENIHDLPQVIHIDISNNRIDYIPEKFGHNCPKLQELKLHNNTIATIAPKWLKTCKKVNTLALNNNHLESIPYYFLQQLPELTDLDLSHNRLSEFPHKELPYATALYNLNLENNALSTKTIEEIQAVAGTKVILTI